MATVFESLDSNEFRDALSQQLTAIYQLQYAVDEYISQLNSPNSSVKEVKENVILLREELRPIAESRPVSEATLLRISTEAMSKGLVGRDLTEFVRVTVDAAVGLKAPELADGSYLRQFGDAVFGGLTGHVNALRTTLDYAAAAADQFKLNELAMLDGIKAAGPSLQALKLPADRVAALITTGFARFDANGNQVGNAGFEGKQVGGAIDKLVGTLQMAAAGDSDTLAKLRAAGIDGGKVGARFKTDAAAALKLTLESLGGIKDPTLLAGRARQIFGDAAGPVIAQMAQNAFVLPKIGQDIASGAGNKVKLEADKRALDKENQQAILINTLTTSAQQLHVTYRNRPDGEAPSMEGAIAGNLREMLSGLLTVFTLKQQLNDISGSFLLKVVPFFNLLSGGVDYLVANEKGDGRGRAEALGQVVGNGLGMVLGREFAAMIGGLLGRIIGGDLYDEAPSWAEIRKKLQSLWGKDAPKDGEKPPEVGSKSGPLRYLPAFPLNGRPLSPQRPSLSQEPLEFQRLDLKESPPANFMQREPEVWALLQKLGTLPAATERLTDKIEWFGAATQATLREAIRGAGGGQSLEYSVRHGGLPVSYTMGI